MLSECRYHASLQNEFVVRYHNAWIEFEPFTLDETFKKTTDSFTSSFQSSRFLSQNKMFLFFKS